MRIYRIASNPRMSVNEPIIPVGNNAGPLFGNSVNSPVTNYTFIIWRF